MTKPTDRAIIARALALLAEGLLVSFLPTFLMREFNLTPERARRLAVQALAQREKQRE